MPIRKELRYFYPIDWPQLSAWVRFARAKGCCEVCGRPHGKIVHHLGDGRWFDEQHETWRDGGGRKVEWPAYGEYRNLKQTRVVLRHRPSRPRPGQLEARQPARPLSALPHDPRPPGTPPAAADHVARPARAGRSIPGSLPTLVGGGRGCANRRIYAWISYGMGKGGHRGNRSECTSCGLPTAFVGPPRPKTVSPAGSPCRWRDRRRRPRL